jgi:hypothetical protein
LRQLSDFFCSRWLIWRVAKVYEKERKANELGHYFSGGLLGFIVNLFNLRAFATGKILRNLAADKRG